MLCEHWNDEGMCEYWNDEVAEPEYWDDEGLKALSARVVKAAPDDVDAVRMGAMVMSGQAGAWKAGLRSAAELKKAAAHFERAAELNAAPVLVALRYDRTVHRVMLTARVNGERVQMQAQLANDARECHGRVYDALVTWHPAVGALREAIALMPNRPEAYFNLGAALASSDHVVEAAQRYLEARERMPEDSWYWAVATVQAFNELTQTEGAE